jgi:transketolase C-terminal domain/subunit
MAAVSQARLCLAGSHPGVSIGRDGPSQMGLEDLAAMRALNGSVVLYPSDANQLNRLVERVAKHKGISYLRVTRAELPVLYPAGEQFRIGGSRILHRSRQDDVTLVAAGITLHEALTAYKDLLGRGIRARVIDLYSVKPVDERTLREAAIATGGRVVTVEDHWPEGGLGDAVLAVLTTANIPLSLAKLAVPALPGSGSPAEQLRAARIDAAAIAEAAVALVAGRATAWRASRSRSSCRGWTPRRSRTSQILRGSAAGFASVIPFGFQSITTIHTGITLAVAVPCAAVLFLCIDRSINQFLASRSRAAGAERPDTDAPEPGSGPI